MSSSVDDVGFIVSLIQKVQREFNVDPERIFIAGMSNGGFLSLRVAYEHSDLFAGVVCMAGGIFENLVRETPLESRVHVLVIHSLSDEMVRYEGGVHPLGLQGPAPIGAIDTLSTWVGYNQC